MGARGRRSKADLSVIKAGGVQTVEDVSKLPRPDAPDKLTDAQAIEWQAVTDRLPVHWFPRETWGMLTQYCRHVVMADRVALLIEKFEGAEEIDIAEYDRLGKMQEREGRAISSLATRLRISNQSTIHPEAPKGTKGKTERPWDK